MRTSLSYSAQPGNSSGMAGQPEPASIWQAHSELTGILDCGIISDAKWPETGLPASRADYIQECRNNAALAYAEQQIGMTAQHYDALNEDVSMPFSVIAEPYVSHWHEGADPATYDTVSERARNGWNELAGLFIRMKAAHVVAPQNGAARLEMSLRETFQQGKDAAPGTERDDICPEDRNSAESANLDPRLFLHESLSQETHPSVPEAAALPGNDEFGICLTRNKSFLNAMHETVEFARKKKIKRKDAVEELDNKIAALNALRGKTGTIDPEAARTRYLQLNTPEAGKKRPPRFFPTATTSNPVLNAQRAAAAIREKQAQSMIKGQAAAASSGRNRIYSSKKIDWTTINTLEEAAHAVFVSCQNGKVKFNSPYAEKYLQAGLNYLNELHGRQYLMTDLKALYAGLTEDRIVQPKPSASRG